MSGDRWRNFRWRRPPKMCDHPPETWWRTNRFRDGGEFLYCPACGRDVCLYG